MSLPAPLTPPEADLQDFPFMPLQVARLRDSDFAAEEDPEACWYAVLLWCASWHQVPAGSLPDSDAVLMKMVGLGRDVRTWKKHRAGALRGFIACSDGRLYHPVVAEQVLSAWDSKLRQRHRTFCATVRKHNERNPNEKRDSPAFEAWVSQGCPANMSEYVPPLSHEEEELSRVTGDENERDIGSKREGQRQGEGQGDLYSNSEANASAASPPVSAPDFCKAVFDGGIALLAGPDRTAAQARSLVGRMRKTAGDAELLVLIAEAQTKTEPAEWLIAAVETRNGNRKPHTGYQPSAAVALLREAGAERAAEFRDEADYRGARTALPSR